MKPGQKKPRFSVGDLIQFKNLKKTRLSGPEAWLDADENFISPGSIGLILERNWVSYEDGETWEYDVSIPDLGVISRGWGDYAFTYLSKNKTKT